MKILVHAILLVILTLPMDCFGTQPVITAADKPIRLIRGVTLHSAGPGVQLEKGDILESGTSFVQIELPPNLVLAIAPKSKLYLTKAQPFQVYLLEGWIKLHTKGEDASIASAFLQADLKNNSIVLRAEVEKVELFSEESSIKVNALDHGLPNGDFIKINQEQIAQRLFRQPLKDLARPTKEFISGMPKPFRDPLGVNYKPGFKVVAPQAQVEVQYADLSQWLNASLPAKKDWVKRFKPLLKDPQFRKSLDAELGESAEWKPILHPPMKKSGSVSANTLF